MSSASDTLKTELDALVIEALASIAATGQIDAMESLRVHHLGKKGVPTD